MSPSQKEAKPKGTSRSSRKSPPKAKSKGAAKTSRKRGKADSAAGKLSKSAFLPLFSAWFVAVVVLAGLLYWAESNTSLTRPTASQPHRAHSLSTGSNHQPRQSGPRKDAERHRAIPGASKPHDADSLAAPHPPGTAAESQAKAALPNSTATHDNQLSLALHRPANTPQPPPTPLPPSSQIAPPPPPEASVARVAIVIDDFGRDIKAAEQFLTVPMPLTFSVLPFRPHSSAIIQLLHAHGREVILHLPMQPIRYPEINPGRGALLVSMSPTRIREVLSRDLDAYPQIAGINNHMGSRFTESSRDMAIVLEELHRRGLFFLDSYTTDRSVGYTLARTLHVPTARRDIFLDDASTPSSIRLQIQRLIDKAKHHGSAIAIGHPHPTTLQVLRQEADLFRREHIAVVPLRELIQR